MKKDSVAPHKLGSRPTAREILLPSAHALSARSSGERPSRTEALRAIQRAPDIASFA
jgi:hypothetical protein